jgi:GxxExxY protein
MPQKQPKEVKKIARKIIENELAKKVIGMAIEIHSALGPGLLERAYQECLYYKIQKSGLNVEKEKPMPLIFEEVKLECGYRIDLLVENKLVLDIKSAIKKYGRPEIINTDQGSQFTSEEWDGDIKSLKKT